MHSYYKTDRRKAWRNLLVCAINEGLRLGLFTLVPRDNRWPPSPCSNASAGHVYSLTLPDGQPASAWVSDINFDELRFHVAAHPIDGFLKLSYPSLRSGGAIAQGFLERRNGKWLQRTASLFRCRRELVPSLAAINVNPDGYSEYGRLII